MPHTPQSKLPLEDLERNPLEEAFSKPTNTNYLPSKREIQFRGWRQAKIHHKVFSTENGDA